MSHDRFDLTDLRLLLDVVEAGSITAGCERSHLALASASARLRQMEDALGATLLERHRSGVRPTPAGRAAVHHARLMLQQVEQMRGDLADHARGMAGRVRVLANTAALTEYLPGALARFLVAHAAIDVDVQERPSHAIVQQLLDGAADLGIVADAVDLTRLEARPFRRDRLVLLVPRGHAQARRRRLAFAEVLGEHFVGLGEDSALHQTLSLQAQRLGWHLRIRVRLRSFEAMGAMVAAGVGLAVVPALAAQRLAAGHGLRVVALSDAWADRELMLCARSFVQLPAHAVRLVETLLKDAEESV